MQPETYVINSLDRSREIVRAMERIEVKIRETQIRENKP